MHTSNTFELLAERTWNRIEAAIELSCLLSEETITENNMLSLKAARLPDIRIYQAKGKDEPKKGFDWEWWIGSRRSGWWRYSVQAKKLKRSRTSSGSYSSLRHKVNGRQQIDILESFARRQKSVPLYCFYNYVDIDDIREYWNCGLQIETKQLGCTVASIDTTRKIHKEYARKSFEKLHSHKDVIPWRCLILCPMIRLLNKHPLSPSAFTPEREEELPSFLTDTESAQVERPAELYSSDLEGYPKRIMVVDTSVFEE